VNDDEVYDSHDDWHRAPEAEDNESQGLLIPAETLSADALTGLIEEFVTRDGTDYGVTESSLAARIEQVRRQIKKGDVSVVFDIGMQVANLVLTRDLSKMNVINAAALDD
jgi:uncharacterized protein YheU (UPF0270 family)